MRLITIGTALAVAAVVTGQDSSLQVRPGDSAEREDRVAEDARESRGEEDSSERDRERKEDS